MQTMWDPATVQDNTPESLKAKFQNVSQDMDFMRDITPHGGAYQNEGDTYEPEPINSFWGKANYLRLMQIKKRLDPDNLLSCFRCVGWDEDSKRHQCFPKI